MKCLDGRHAASTSFSGVFSGLVERWFGRQAACRTPSLMAAGVPSGIVERFTPSANRVIEVWNLLNETG
jgi:hypothetical protein